MKLTTDSFIYNKYKLIIQENCQMTSMFENITFVSEICLQNKYKFFKELKYYALFMMSQHIF